MDIYTDIVSVLALGAATGLKSTAEQTVKDIYVAVKSLINRKYPQIDTVAFEEKPESEAQQKTLAEGLAVANAAQDKELVKKVDELLELLKVTGITIENVEAKSLSIRSVLSSGDALVIRESRFENDIKIEDIQAGIPVKKNATEG